MSAKSVGPYEILEKLGAGGMGEVWRARDPRLGRDVALKFLLGDAAKDPERLRRFLAEARTVSGLNHPNIVTLHEIGEADGRPYLVTELVEGHTIRSLLANGPLPASQALDVAIQAARGLQKAHDSGVVHRDVKPENLMLTKDGFVKILDFGLAKLCRPDDATLLGAGGDPSMTAPGVLLGTPAYISPEQLQGRAVDARTDVFALGIVLHEMLTGSNPFRRDSAIGTMHAILNEPAPAIDTRARGLPLELADIVARATRKGPESRFASAREMETSLAAVRTRIDSGVLLAAGRPRPTLHRAGVAVGVVSAIALLVVLFRGLVPSTAPVDPADALRMAEQSLAGLGAPPVPGTPAIALPEGETGVMVLPFEDLTNDPLLREASIGDVLADALVQVLNDIEGLYVISPYRIEAIAKDLGRSREDTTHDPRLARDVGMRAKAGALLSGSLRKIGASYVLNARLVEIPSERVLESVQARAEKPDRLLDELTGTVAAKLQEKYAASGADRTSPARLRGPATSSLDAYAHFVRGDDLVQEGDWKGAVSELEKAVEIDPEMALGWSSLACAYSFSGDDTRARAAHLKASEFVDRLNEMERRWLALNGLWIVGADGGAYMAELKRYIHDFPDDRDSYFYAGLAEEWLNRDYDAALGWYEKAYRMVPGYYPVTDARADCLMKLGRKEEAVRALTSFLAQPQPGEVPRGKAQAKLLEIRGRS